MTDQHLSSLVRELIALPDETEWVEFKHNNDDPQEIGEYLSALANAAALHDKSYGYLLWGIEDVTHRVLGTSFKPRQAKKGNEELQNWLSRMLDPRIDFIIQELTYQDKPLVLFEIPRATTQPVRFGGEEFIRIGSNKRKLREFPEKERSLWQVFQRTPFEQLIARENVSGDDATRLLDYPAYFELTQQPLPANRQGILDKLLSEKFLLRRDNGRYDITNLGAILFAKNLIEFGRLARKSIRVVVYQGTNRVETVREQTGVKGYAVGFEGAISFINGLLPQNEVIGQALRREVRMYPEIAIRELVANAIIHQDFTLTGTGPMVEVFTDRIEINNPGVPLIDTLRFIDEPPQSRNEALASFMRRINVCEERGSGIDKVIFNVEVFQLPAPQFSVHTNHTSAILYAHRDFAEMSRDDRIRACYQHACLQFVSNQLMTNTSLRKRFGIIDSNAAQASRIISDTLHANLIKSSDPENQSRRHVKYLPFWA